MSSFISPVNFKIGLLNYNFDSKNNDVRLYNDKLERDIAFSNKIEIEQELVNLEFNNNISFSIKFEINSLNEAQILKILNYNYCVIKNNLTNENSYYFINSSSQIDSTMILLNLTIDHIQTYYYDIEIPLATIEQAHLNRWIPVENKFMFNDKIDSLLFSNNLNNLSKFMAKRFPINACIDTYSVNSDFNNFIKDVNWIIIYMYPGPISGVNNFDNFRLSEDGVVSGYKIAVFPISKNVKLNVTNTSGQKEEWSISSFNLFLSQPNIQNHVASIKVTPICPLNVTRWLEGINWIKELDGSITITTLIGNNFQHFSYPFASNLTGWTLCLLFPSVHPAYNIIDISQFSQTIFELSEIINKDNNIATEPHLLNMYNRELTIVDFAGNRFSYDLQKMGQNRTILFTETLTPDITKSYIRIKGINDNIYNEDTENNFVGLVISNETSLSFSENQLSAFLSQNKNFYIQQQLNRDYNWLNVGKDAIFGAIGGSIGNKGIGSGVLGSVGGAVVGAFDTLLSNQLNLTQQNLMIDNLKSAPSMIKNAQGNLLFYLQTNQNLKFYLEYYRGIDQDIKKQFWTLFLFGYPLSITDNIKNYDNTRVLFNYVKAHISIISGNISGVIKDMFKETFAKGVRFWHNDDIDYTKANYEKYLTKNIRLRGVINE